MCTECGGGLLHGRSIIVLIICRHFHAQNPLVARMASQCMPAPPTLCPFKSAPLTLLCRVDIAGTLLQRACAAYTVLYQVFTVGTVPFRGTKSAQTLTGECIDNCPACRRWKKREPRYGKCNSAEKRNLLRNCRKTCGHCSASSTPAAGILAYLPSTCARVHADSAPLRP